MASSALGADLAQLKEELEDMKKGWGAQIEKERPRQVVLESLDRDCASVRAGITALS